MDKPAQTPVSEPAISRWATILLFLCYLFLGAALNLGAGPVEGELLVKFRGGANGAEAAAAEKSFGHEVKKRFRRTGWQHIKLPPGLSIPRAIAVYERHPNVLAVEPNYTMQLKSLGTQPPFVPNDPRLNEQWALAKIGATNAWSITTGDSNVVVAVLDTGVRYTHEEMSPTMWRNTAEIPGNGLDDDSNGYIDDIYGIDPASQDSDPMDQPVGFTFHGTACASIIGAAGNNGLGMAGLNWNVRIMALRVAATSNFIAAAWVVEAFEYIFEMKSRGVNVRVTSNSYGLDDAPSSALRDSLEAAGEADILSVFAAGNSSQNLDVVCQYPACYRLPGMINVAMSTQTDTLHGLSNYGATNVDLAAPGVGILVADGIVTNGYNPGFTGTSAACPQVAGAAALLAAAYPAANIAQIKKALLESVDVIPALTGKVATDGRLNVAAAIHHPGLATNAPPRIFSSPGSQTIGEGYPFTLQVIATAANPTAYYWKFEGTDFAQTATPALTVSSATLAHEGNYLVVVSNALGSATSAVAMVSIVTTPTILLQPVSVRALDGSNVCLSVTAAGGYPLAYQWQRNNEDISGATESTLILSNVNGTATANYRVVLSNAHAQVSSDTAQVTVFTRPYIISQPENQTVAVGGAASISVTVTNTATTPLGFRWLRNGPSVGVTIQNSFTGTTNILNIPTNASGTWTVLVTNEAPSGVSLTRSSNAIITVVIPPTNKTVLIGSNATFSALAFGPGQIRYQWQRNGTNIPNATATNLSLANVQPSHAGTYAVVVTNSVGQPTSFPASLQVVAPEPLLSAVQPQSGGTFEFLLSRLVPQQQYAVEASEALTNWSVLQNIVATNSNMPFIDFTATNATRRFYKARWIP